MQNTIRTTALLFFIMVISIITTSNKVKNLPVGFIAISLGLNYLLMFYLGARLRRFKIWLYPLMFILNPFFNWLYMVYGIFTAGQRTWGGPRADAAAADEHTTPKEAVEQATAQGDELNVNVETFRRWMLTHPSERVGCCSAEHPNESGHNLSQLVTPLLPDVPRLPLQPRQSFDSMVTTDTSTCSICMSRRVESTTAEDDQMNLYPDHQAQRLSSLRKDPAESDNMDCANSAPFLRKTNPREWEMHELGVQPPFQTPQTPGLETIYHITRPETTLDPSRYLRPTRQRLGRSTPKWLFQDWNGDEDASEAGPSAESVHDLEGLRCKRGKKRRWISENPQDPVYIA
jgi:chitin synthase